MRLSYDADSGAAAAGAARDAGSLDRGMARRRSSTPRTARRDGGSVCRRFALGAIPDVIGLYRLPRTVVPDGVPASWSPAGLPPRRTQSRRTRRVHRHRRRQPEHRDRRGHGRVRLHQRGLFPTLPGVADQDRLIEIYMERSALDERRRAAGVHSGRARHLVHAADVVCRQRRERQLLRCAAHLSPRTTSTWWAPGCVRAVASSTTRLGRRTARWPCSLDAVATAVWRRDTGRRVHHGGGHPVQIVGVAEHGFSGTNRTFDGAAELWVPLAWRQAGCRQAGQ